MTARPIQPRLFEPAQRGVSGAGAIVIDFIFAAALASLFLPFQWQTPVGYTRPFDYLSILCVVAAMSRLGGGAFVITRSMLPHLAYLAVYVISALTVSAINGVREIIQIFTVLFFLGPLVAYVRSRPDNKVFVIASALLLALCAYAIYWHIAHRYFVGWKILDEPKAIFIFLPAMLAAALPGPGQRQPWWALPAIAAMMVIIILSGERKAYMTGAVFIAAYFGVLNPRLLIVAAIGALALPILAAADPQGYVARQLDTVINPPHVENLYTLDYVNMPSSLSNAQRQFSWEVGMQLLAREPFFGIGTNQYGELMNARFGYLPSYLRLDIHGEFQRSLVENGIIGVALYAIAWVFALFALLRHVRVTKLLTGMKGRELTLTLLFAGAFVFCAFEAQKSLSMVAFVGAGLLGLLLPAQQFAKPAPPRAQRA
ncbi:MAG: O-antigen ligase family protein [Hyphomonadaceae bacterium]